MGNLRKRSMRFTVKEAARYEGLVNGHPRIVIPIIARQDNSHSPESVVKKVGEKLYLENIKTKDKLEIPFGLNHWCWCPRHSGTSSAPDGIYIWIVEDEAGYHPDLLHQIQRMFPAGTEAHLKQYSHNKW
eukprot:gnl/Hemi2/26093_TR8759_c0_g1_i1.p1 gnl/Hemi2/26093_TR8759_c0_g1~~gnl/Hemi2/26093_TR8759_c0_g1_i1.p1  ORF type:complete len:130 (+),score=45.30 gnl/Hemi2/26093_TR8759_c0_g1_i1:244-633(+)